MGAADLAVLTRHDGAAIPTKSELEVLFLTLCRDHGLPRPAVNARIADKEVDFAFEAARLVVETDSWRYHRTRHAFENDRARDAILARAGYRTLRFTDRPLTTDSRGVAETIATVLGCP